MYILNNFNNNILKYDLINKFFYKTTKEMPKLRKIILNFGCKTSEIKKLASSLLAIELITNRKASLTTTKKSNILLKIRKGNPTGCKITLRKNEILQFLFKINNEIFPKMKNFEGFEITKRIKKDAFSFELQETLSFTELEKHYHLFNNLPKLSITIVSQCKHKEELILFLRSYQLPIRN